MKVRRVYPLTCLIVVALFCATTLAYALTFPPLTGRVVDEAGILDAATTQSLTSKLAAMEAKSGDQLVVVTLKSLQGTSIEDYGYQLGRSWGIGQKGVNNGALLIVAPTERKVRIEVGYGLEGALTDAVSKFIIENAILPRFRAGDFAGGITRGADDIIQVMSGDAEEFKRRAAQRPDDAPPSIDLGTLILLGIVIFIIFMSIRGGGSGGFGPGGRRRRGYNGPIFIPSGGSWSSGSSGGFGGGGGGFSGGGGSFGGGGSSGSW
ncbi:MAG: YgcG family protein [Variibacter sp.]